MGPEGPWTTTVAPGFLRRRGAHGGEQGGDPLRRASEHRSWSMPIAHHLPVDDVFEAGVDAPPGEVLETQIAVAIEGYAGQPGVQVGLLSGVGGKQAVGRKDADVAE